MLVFYALFGIGSGMEKLIASQEMIMAASQKSHDALDQSRDVIAIQAHVADGHLTISQSDRQILRRLAGAVAELAARPIEDEKTEIMDTTQRA